MKNRLLTLMLPLCAYVTHASCSEGPKILKIRTLTDTLEVPFTDATTIRDIKQNIHDNEGIPVSHQRLTKPEGWSLGLFRLPKQVTTKLENHQTCGHYDLQNNQSVDLCLFLKNQAQIDAELQARAAAIRTTVEHKPLPPVLVDVVTSYDTHNED